MKIFVPMLRAVLFGTVVTWLADTVYWLATGQLFPALPTAGAICVLALAYEHFSLRLRIRRQDQYKAQFDFPPYGR